MSISTNSPVNMMISNVKSKSIMNVEIGTKVFSIINCIITGLMSMISFAFTPVYVILMHRDEYVRFVALLLVASVAFFVSGFGFGIALAIGAFERKIKFMKTYIIYGIIVNSLVFCISLVALIYWSHYYEAECAIYVSIAVGLFCVVYSAILYMIWKTMHKYRNDLQYQHTMLMEARC